MRFDRVTFDNGRGQQLAARLDRPDGPPVACALFAHCFTCSKDLKAAGHISRALTAQGFAVLRFDFTGLGASEGDFADTTFSSNVDDLVAAAHFMADELEAPSVLVGHSLGGAAVLQAAARLDRVKAVATIGAPHGPEHVAHLLEDDRATIEREGAARVTLAGRTFTIKKAFLDDLEGHTMDAVIGGLERALLVFHGPLDQTVGIENAAALFEAAKHPKSFVSLDRADHLLTREADARYVGSVLGAWARTYVADGVRAEPPARDGFQAAARTERTRFRTAIAAQHHTLVADEPRDLGGADAGPTPYDLLASALAACKTMTLRMYADRKDWPLEAVTARVQHAKIRAADCADCATEKGKVDRFTVEIDLTGADLTDAQRARLYEIADRCPVHRTFNGEIDVQSSLREA